MKKRGFTLVELLAVIAILAILVIMALPAVLNMFTQARIDTFENEVKTIFRTAEQQYLLNGGGAIDFGNAYSSTMPSGKKCRELDMTGNTSLKYYIKMDANGNVVKLMATNGTYHYTTGANDLTSGLAIDAISVTGSESTVTPTNCTLVNNQ